MEVLIQFLKCLLKLLMQESFSLASSQTFWTAVGAIGTVFTLVLILKQISNAKNVAAYELLRKEYDRFWSKEVRRKRENLAEILLQFPGNYEKIEEIALDILDYFEALGLMLRRGVAPKYFVWTFKYYYITYYWKLLENYVKWSRKKSDDDTLYSEFEYLYNKMVKYEKKKRRKKEIELTTNDLNKILIEELGNKELKLLDQLEPKR